MRSTDSVDVVLRFRIAVERMQWLRLQSIHAEQKKLETHISGLESSRNSSRLQLLDALRKGVSARECAAWGTKGIEAEIERAKQRGKELNAQFQKEREVYLARRQEREIAESALARLHAEIAKEVERKDQMRVDDEILMRMTRSKK